MMRSTVGRLFLGLQSGENGKGRTPEQWLDQFYSGWFSSKASTEAMISSYMRGSANESAGSSVLRCFPVLMEVIDVGMVAMKDAPDLACSPDGIALLDPKEFDDW